MIIKVWKLLTSEVKFGDAKDGPKTRPGQMDLAQRMELRTDMVHQSVREHLLALEVLSSAYRFRVMPVDARAHHFMVLIEVANSFEPKLAGYPISLSQVEEHLQSRTRDRYGVFLDGVFWKMNEKAARFEDAFRAGERGDSRVAAHRAAQPRPTNSPSMEPERLKLSRGRTSQISDIELSKLRSAVRDKQPIPAIKVGEDVYETSMAPLQ